MTYAPSDARGKAAPVRAGAVALGWAWPVRRPVQAPAFGNELFEERVIRRVAARRCGTGGGFGGLAVYLRSDARTCDSGENSVVDGGRTRF